MKRLVFKLFLFCLGGYVALNLLFASSPIQQRIIKEVRKIAEPQGLQLSINNIDVSLFVPKLYLNHVSIRTTPQAIVNLPNALSIERVKIEINPLSIIYGQLTISEIALFQPKIILEEADVLYKKIDSILKSQTKWKVKGQGFNVEIERVGIVDAYVLVTLKEPAIGIDSGRFTLFVEKSAKEQFNIVSNFSNLSLDRGKFHTVIRSADFDLDITPKSLRANRVSLDSDWLSLSLKGATSFPVEVSSDSGSFRAVYEIRTSLSKLTEIEEFKKEVPKDISGVVLSSGTLEKVGKGYVGAGKISVQDFLWDGYSVASGETSFTADGKKAIFKDVSFGVDKGKIKSEKVVMEFKERSPIQGEIQIENVELNSLLKKFKVMRNPAFVGMDGQARFTGYLEAPLAIEGEINTELKQLLVLAHIDQPINPENTVISVEKAKLTSSFNIGKQSGTFKSQLQILDGVLVAFSRWRPGSPIEIDVEGKGLSLTRLAKIQELSFGGVADVQAKIGVEEGEPVISGSFDLKNGEIAKVVLGSVRGKVNYQNDLLSFESLELPSLDAIRAHGFVDFEPKDTRYKFEVSSKRASVDQVFQFFSRNKLDFTPPKGGELAAKVTLQGGHDAKGIQVSATGTVRGINWFDEKWLGGSFALTYRDDFVEISRGTLTKPRGALGFQGLFKGNQSNLKLQSYGLKLEDLDHVLGTPIAGEIVGQINLEGDLTRPNGQGELKLIKTLFRNQSLGDSNISIKESPDRTEFIGNLFGQSLQGRVISGHRNRGLGSELLLNFKNCNVLPLISILSGKDLPAFGAIRATGDLEINGDLNEWQTLSGSGTLGVVELDLKTAPVRNQRPISFEVEKGAIKVPPFELAGQDSLVSGYIEFNPKQSIKAGLDAKLDLLYLQPFIPGLEYGAGKVTAGLRFSGALPKFDMLGNLTLEDGSFRIKNLSEDFRNVRTQLSITQDNIRIDRFDATHGGGSLQLKGGVEIERFNRFSPNLTILAKGIGFRQQNYLTLKVSGDLQLKGKEFPYLLAGNCNIDEGRLSEFDVSPATSSESTSLKFDLKCQADRGFLVDTEIMQAEWKGNFHLLGDNRQIGLLGTAESIKGTVFFKETQFNLTSGSVKFESRDKISPRFNVLAKSFVKEQRTQVPIEYEVTLNAYGTPQDYKIRLSSVPALAEPDLIALLILGVTTRGQDDNYLDFGSTLVGKSPLQSKLQNELGVNIKVNMQRSGVGATGGSSGAGGTPANSTTGTPDSTVPALKIQKEITNKTKLSYSSTLDQNAMKEFKIEQLLDENFTVNASAVDKFRGTTQNDSIKSYGLDFRYRFQFE